MPHTQSRYQQDLGFTDGRIFCGPGEIIPNSSANGVITRNAAGDWSVNQAQSLTVIYAVNVAQAILRRTGFGEDLQEQYGGTGIAGSAQFQGRPDTIPAMSGAQQLTPRTAFKIKGYKLLSFDVIYTITTNNLTAHTCRVDKTTHADNVAPAIASVLASGANGLATTQRANEYVTNVALAANQQIYRTVADEALWIEVSSQTPASSTYRIYGIDLACEFNFN